METTSSSRDWPGVVATVLGTVWLALFPLWQDGSFSRITRAKWQGMLLLFAVTAAVVAVMVVVLAVRGHLTRTIRFHPVQGLVLAYFAWVTVSAFFGSYAGTVNSQGQRAVFMGAIRYEGLVTQLIYGGIFLLMSLVRPQMTWLLRAVAVAMMLFFAVTLMQYAGANPLGLFPAGRSVRTNYEFQGTMGNIDMVSGYLNLTVPMLLGGFVLLRRADPLLLAAGLCGVMDLLLIGVQSGLIALALAMGLLAVLFLLRPRCRWRVLLIAGGMLVLLGVRMMLGLPWLEGTADIVFPFQPSGLTWGMVAAGAVCMGLSPVVCRHPGKAVSVGLTAVLAVVCIAAGLAVIAAAPLTAGGLWELQQLLLGNAQDSFGSYRLGVWRHTLAIARENLLFGTGPDTFLYALRDRLTQLGQTLPETFDNPHNLYLAILSGNGLPALLCFLLAIGTLLTACLRRRTPETVLLLCGLVCYLMQGMFTFSICLISPMFWAVCGMACAWCGRAPMRSCSGKPFPVGEGGNVG
ncbi:MAG: O-antigen ligase family protein [Aristaeellaceae bacterium]